MEDNDNAFWLWNGWTAIAAMGAFVAALATMIYTRYTYEILSATRDSIIRQNKVHEFEIFSKLSAELETEKALTLGYACKTNSLKIDLPLGEALTSEFRNETATTDSHLRQHLLNPLEKLAKFWSDGLISIDTLPSGMHEQLRLLFFHGSSIV
jgi:hypothetical protein